MKPVLVSGDGVAAYCCAHLLDQAGIPVAVDRPNRPRLPAIMLSEAAIALIADVFGCRDLFCDLPRIQSRAVMWGPGADLVTVPHLAVVVSEETLLDSIRPQLRLKASAADAGWRVFASGPLPPGCQQTGFGSRIAYASAVDLKCDAPGCWVESLEDGWLFLIGNGAGQGWLISVGSARIEQSRLVAEQIERISAPGGQFPAFPRVISPLGGAPPDGWLACGTAAIAFDPLCGDGTAHAVREAILASAVIRAIDAGGRAGELLAHYEARLTAGFQKHLMNCAGFYRSGGSSSWWKTELNQTERGIGFCAEKLSRFPGFRYRLNGYQLEAVA